MLLVPKAAENGPRERVLTDAEVALTWRCTAGGHDYDRILRLLLLTVARRDEVLEQHGARHVTEHLRGDIRPGRGDAVGGCGEAAGAVT